MRASRPRPCRCGASASTKVRRRQCSADGLEANRREACGDERVESLGYTRDAAGGRARRRCVQNLVADRQVVVAFEDRLAGEQEVADGAQRVDVGARVDILRIDDALRCHVARRAEDLDLLRDVARLLGLQVLHEAEVQQLDDVVLAAPAQHHVLRLDVAVDHSVLVCLAQRGADLAQDMQHPTRRHRTGLRDELRERHAVQIFHNVIRPAFARAPEVVDAHGVRMQELARELHFALEAVDELVGGDVLLQDLDRRGPLEHRVAREIDRCHAAFADLALERVRAQPLQLAELPLQARQRHPRRHGRAQRQHDEPADHREADPQVAQRREGLRRGDFGDDADVVGREPAPGADHFVAAIAAVRLHDHALAIGIEALAARRRGQRRGAGQRPCRGLEHRRVTRVDIAAGIADGDRECRWLRVVLGQQAARDQRVREPRRREHQAVFRERVRLRGGAGTRGAEHAGEITVRHHADGQRDRGRTRLAAHGRDQPRHGPALAIGAGDRQFGLGMRSHELRGAVERAIQSVAKDRGVHTLSAARRILRRDDDAGAIDHEEADDPARADARLQHAREFDGIGRLAQRARGGGIARGRRGESAGALLEPRLFRQPFGFGAVLADPDLDAGSDGADQRLQADRLRLRDRVAHTVVGPVAEADQQHAHDHRRRVAPGLGLDEVRDEVGNRVRRRLRVADADVEHPHALGRAIGGRGRRGDHRGRQGVTRAASARTTRDSWKRSTASPAAVVRRCRHAGRRARSSRGSRTPRRVRRCSARTG